MGRRSRELIKTRFAAERSLAMMENVYEQTIKASKARDTLM